MFHLIACLLGYTILLYELVHEQFSFFVTFSSWFGVITTFAHTIQIVMPIWYAVAYMMVSFACFFMLPSAFFTLTTAEDTLARWLLNDFGLHLVLPLCAFTHVEGTFFRGPIQPVLLSCVCFTIYLLMIEAFAQPLPYDLNTYNTTERILLYVATFIVQCLGILFITNVPYFRRSAIP